MYIHNVIKCMVNIQVKYMELGPSWCKHWGLSDMYVSSRMLLFRLCEGHVNH